MNISDENPVKNSESEIEEVSKQSEDGVKLKRQIGLFSATNLIIGVMVGSGIFLCPSAALEYSGSVGLCLIIWLLCGVLCLLGALSYAELGTIVGKSGAEYAYIQEAFGNMHKFWGPLPAFLCSWVHVITLKPAEVAVIIMGFAEYTTRPFTTDLKPYDKDRVTTLISLCSLYLITYINIRSVNLFVKIQNFFVACKLSVCIIIIGGGLYEIAKGNTENIGKGFEGSSWHPGYIALAMYSGLYPYDGWNHVTAVTEEIINPGTNIRLSILIAVPAVTTVYMLMNVAYMTSLTFKEMVSETAVAVTFGDRVLGPFKMLIPLGVSISAFSSAMSVQFGVTRVCYTAARDGNMLEVLAFVNIKRLTPAPAVAFQAIMTTIYIIIGNIQPLIEFVSWFLWFFYGLAMVSLLILRKSQANKYRPYRVPTIFPWIVLAASIFLIVLPVIHEPSFKYIAAIGFLVGGSVVYAIFVYNKKSVKILKRFTYMTQILLESAPPDMYNYD